VPAIVVIVSKETFMSVAAPRERASCPFDHHSAEFAQHYLADYARLRELGPVVWTDAHGGYWVATTFQAVRGALLDAGTFVARSSDDRTKGGIHIPRPDRARLRPRAIPSETDGREHDDARVVLNRDFSVKRVAELEPMIERHVRNVIAQVVAMGEFDIIYDLASPVIAGVVDEHLGLGSDDPPNFFRAISAMVGGTPGNANSEEVTARFQQCWEFVVTAIQAGLDNPGDGVISHLAAETSPKISVPEIQSMVFNVILGGSDTAANLTAYSMIRLFEDPELRAGMRANPGDLPRFLDEILRVSDIVMGIARTVTRDVEFHGAQLREGDRIFLPLAAANHDPAQYANPDQFDLERGAARHVAMGAGSHFCLGANLGRTLVAVILRELLTTAPEYEILSGQIDKTPNKATNNTFRRVPARFLAPNA
jgi:cytochrome P450